MLVLTEVYSTNISTYQDAENLDDSFKEVFPNASIFFDLEDGDKIMKVVASIEILALIPDWLKNFGFDCTVLPD